MAESNDFPTNNSVPEHPLEETTPEETAPGSQNQVVSNTVTEQPAPTITPPRDWILYLPPEVRAMVFRYVLRLPHPVPYYLPTLWGRNDVQAQAGILRTSRLIYRESIDVFYNVNTFFFLRHWRITVAPSQTVGHMIQNLDVDIDLRLSLTTPAPRAQFHALTRIFGDPARVRGTLSFRIFFPEDRPCRPNTLQYFVRRLHQFSNFRTVEVNFRFTWYTHASSRARLYNRVETNLRTRLGPAGPRAAEESLIFLPQQFLKARRLREDLERLRLDGNGDRTDPDQNMDEPEPGSV